MNRRDQPRRFSYREAGVDIAGGARAKQRIGELASQTYTGDVLGQSGHFGGMFRSPGSGKVLVSSADSVGTKVLVAVLAGRHDSIGVDLVNHSINDILCVGARPLFFLDYFATPDLDDQLLEALVSGMSRACSDAGCALIGGETAQLPGIYRERTYDLAGFIVGQVDESNIIDGSTIKPGQDIVGIASNGLHTNGYSLARSVFGLDERDPQGASTRLDAHIPELGESLSDALLRPHRSYLKAVEPMLDDGAIKGMAHITGGGIAGNLERIIPEYCSAIIDTSSWRMPGIFQIIQLQGQVDWQEMFAVFNMGIGFIMVMDSATATQVSTTNQDAYIIGNVIRSEPGQPRVDLRNIEP